MREIKFRAWDLQAKKWIEPFTLVNIELNGTIIHVDSSKPEGSQRLIRKDIVLCQFTGLRDVDGKEIYEGDIVRFTYNSTPQEERTGVVEWNEECCAWCFDRLLIEPTPRKTIEVICNIYENSLVVGDEE